MQLKYFIRVGQGLGVYGIIWVYGLFQEIWVFSLLPVSLQLILDIKYTASLSVNFGFMGDILGYMSFSCILA